MSANGTSASSLSFWLTKEIDCDQFENQNVLVCNLLAIFFRVALCSVLLFQSENTYCEKEMDRPKVQLSKLVKIRVSKARKVPWATKRVIVLRSAVSVLRHNESGKEIALKYSIVSKGCICSENETKKLGYIYVRTL